MRRFAVVVCTLAVLVAGCGDEAATSTTEGDALTATEVEVAAAEETEEGPPTRSVRQADAPSAFDLDVFCGSLDVVTQIVLAAEDIALGSADDQQFAEEQLDEAAAVVAEQVGEEFPDITEALMVLTETGLTVRADDEYPFDPEVVQDAGDLLIEYFDGSCADVDPVSEDGGSGECPAPEVLEENGVECDEFGNIFSAAGECPAPEVLDENGVGCDEFGNIFPLDVEPMDTVEECPAPETLEAEGLACDEFGNLYPIADGSDFEGSDFEGSDFEGYDDEGYYDEGGYDESYDEPVYDESYEEPVYDDEGYDDGTYEEPVYDDQGYDESYEEPVYGDEG